MRHHHSPGIRGQLMWFCVVSVCSCWRWCGFCPPSCWNRCTPSNIEKQLTTQAESITAELDKAIANGEALSAWSFGHLTVNTAFF